MSNFNFNKVILGGRIASDIELKTTTSGVHVTTFSVAVSRRGAKDQEPKVDFFNCTAWRSTSEFITRFFDKGSSICIVGTLQNRSWTDQQGNKRYATDIVVDEANFVDSKNEGRTQDTQPANYVPEANFEEVEVSGELPF